MNDAHFNRLFVMKLILIMLFSTNIFAQRITSRDPMNKINNLVSLTDSKFQGLRNQLVELKEPQYDQPANNEVTEDSLITSIYAELTSISGQVEKLASNQQNYTDLESQLLQKLNAIDENLSTLVPQPESEQNDQESPETETNLEATPPADIQDLLGNLEISGFFDLQNRYNLSPNENEGLNYGQFEVDIAKGINNYISVEGAIAFNSGDGLFELGAGFLDCHLLGDAEEHPVRGNFLTHSGIIVGQFDVPFGIDYLYIPSPDRKLLTSPLANEKTINSMNDFGAIIYGGSEHFDFCVFGINGFTEKGAAVGGRIGFHPVEFIKVRTSYMTDLYKLNEADSKVFGLDLRANINSFELKGEFILSDGLINGELDENGISNRHSGYYVQATNDLQSILKIPVFMSLRFGSWNADFYKDELAVKDNANRITSALGYMFTESLEVRFEFITQKDKTEQRTSSLAAQLVVSF